MSLFRLNRALGAILVAGACAALPSHAQTPAGAPAAPPAAAPAAPVNLPPGGAPQAVVPASASSAPAPALRPIERGQIIARIGSDVVIAADILPRVLEIMEKFADKIPPDEAEEIRRELMRRELQQLLETKLLYVDAQRKIPAENLPKIEQRVSEQFEDTEIPRLIKESKVASRAELESKLVAYGSSLPQSRRQYFERMLGSQWLRQQIDMEPRVDHNDMLAWYREHLTDYEFEARARWEEIMVRFDKHPSKAAAYAALVSLGNQVQQGTPFNQVAVAGSDGVTADRGGQWDWTSRGSLKSEAINRAIFSLPVGQLSQIIESERGFHILRVLERHDAGRKPFEEAQVSIKETIQKKRRNESVKAYLERLKKDTPIWTMFDADRPAAQTAAQPGATQQR